MDIYFYNVAVGGVDVVVIVHLEFNSTTRVHAYEIYDRLSVKRV